MGELFCFAAGIVALPFRAQSTPERRGPFARRELPADAAVARRGAAVHREREQRVEPRDRRGVVVRFVVRHDDLVSVVADAQRCEQAVRRGSEGLHPGAG